MSVFFKPDHPFVFDRFSLKAPLQDSLGFVWRLKTSTLKKTTAIMELLDPMPAFLKR
jgi:hypothetical protein